MLKIHKNFKKMSLALFFSMCLSLSFTSNLSANAEAPDFVLKSVDSGNVRLSEYYGEVILLNFWATWCGPCRIELPKLTELQKKYQRAGFSVLAVNVDKENSANVSKFLSEVDVNFPVLLDGKHKVVSNYDVKAMPGTVFIGRDGQIRYTHLGYQEGDEKKYAQIIESLLKE
jgi:peroxiredoxin